MDSSLSTHRVDGIGNLILPWRKLQRGRLQQGCTFVRYVTNHSREKIISHSTCRSVARNVSNAVSVLNVTAEERNWKSTYFVTTPMTTKSLPKSHWSVHIVPRWRGGKTFLQNYIKYHYSDRHVITTEIATSTKDIAHYLSKFPLECKDIFLFNHPCSTTDVVAYDLLEGIKDGYKISAKYDTRGLVFKTPNTVIAFSNNFPNTEALKKDRWKVYEIIGEELCDKTLWSTKPKLHVIQTHKNYTIYDDWGCENMRNGVDRQFYMNKIVFMMKWIFFMFWEIYIWQLGCIAFVDWGKLFQSSLRVGLLCRVCLAGNS